MHRAKALILCLVAWAGAGLDAMPARADEGDAARAPVALGQPPAPRHVPVPDVRLLSEQDAVRVLAESGLRVAAIERVSVERLRAELGRSYEVGKVVQQAPRPSTGNDPSWLQRGAPVWLRVASERDEGLVRPVGPTQPVQPRRPVQPTQPYVPPQPSTPIVPVEPYPNQGTPPPPPPPYGLEGASPPMVPTQPYGARPTDPYVEPTAPYREPTAPYQEPTAPYREPTAPYQEPTAPYQEPTAPYQEPTAPYQAPTDPYTESAAPYQEPGTDTWADAGYYGQDFRSVIGLPCERGLERWHVRPVGGAAFWLGDEEGEVDFYGGLDVGRTMSNCFGIDLFYRYAAGTFDRDVPGGLLEDAGGFHHVGIKATFNRVMGTNSRAFVFGGLGVSYFFSEDLQNDDEGVAGFLELGIGYCVSSAIRLRLGVNVHAMDTDAARFLPADDGDTRLLWIVAPTLGVELDL